MNTFSLGNTPRPPDFLTELTTSNPHGLWHITAGGVAWCLDFFNGRLRYSCHSCQTINTIELHLQALGYGAAIDASQRLFEPYRREHGSQYHSDSLDLVWMHRLVQQLSTDGTLSWNQANILMNQLSKDSLESVLWLTNGTITQLENSSPLYNAYDTIWHGTSFNALMQISLNRLHVWQQFGPYIQSPHQCPRFQNLYRIYEDVPGGMIPPSRLEALHSIMGGVSLREISQILNQDELKLAQLLYPYVEQGIIVFDRPEPPFCDLPLVPSPNSLSAGSSSEVMSGELMPDESNSVNTQQQYPGHYPSPPGSSRAKPQKQYKIVCIDDSPTMLETLRCYLEDDCFEVTTLDNPMQSASTMFSSRPDLVLMDIAMPGINGHRLCKILRQSSAFKQIPIIMVSGLTGEVDRAEAIAMGANDYLAKPFSQEALLALVDQYLPSAGSA